MERKRVAFEVKDIDVEAGTFSGHASIFNVPDDGMPPDIMLPGAFAKTVREWGPSGANRIKILALHRNDWLPIGAPLELIEDATGLFFKGFVSQTSLGRDVLTLMRDRVLTEMSIGFDVIKYEKDQNLGIRRLMEVRLWEISPVTWAMHPLATIADVKAIRTMTDRDLYDLSAVPGSAQAGLALSGTQPESSTAPDAAANDPAPTQERGSLAYDPELCQSIKALTADIQSAIATRRTS